MPFGPCMTCPGPSAPLFQVRDDAGVIRQICGPCLRLVRRLDFENLNNARRGMVRTAPPMPNEARIYFLPTGGPPVLWRHAGGKRRR